MVLNSIGQSAGTVYFCNTHSHKNWELVCVTSGSGILVCDSGNYRFKENTVYAVPPNTPHKCISENGFCDIYIRVNDLDLLANEVTFCNTYDADFSVLAKLAFKMHCKAKDEYSMSLSAVANAFVTLFIDSINEDFTYLLSPSVRDFIVLNFGNANLNANYLEQKFNYSYEYIKRCFKKDFGMTPIEYIGITRMKRAKELLKSEHNYSIEHISRVCGFSDKLYFSRVFKKFYGTSPAKYKKEYSGSENF